MTKIFLALVLLSLAGYLSVTFLKDKKYYKPVLIGSMFLAISALFLTLITLLF